MQTRVCLPLWIFFVFFCDVSGQVDLSGHTDAATVSGYAKEALAWANAEGLITGVTDTTLHPTGLALRAQTATILMRLCENFLSVSSVP